MTKIIFFKKIYAITFPFYFITKSLNFNFFFKFFQLKIFKIPRNKNLFQKNMKDKSSAITIYKTTNLFCYNKILRKN